MQAPRPKPSQTTGDLANAFTRLCERNAGSKSLSQRYMEEVGGGGDFRLNSLAWNNTMGLQSNVVGF